MSQRSLRLPSVRLTHKATGISAEVHCKRNKDLSEASDVARKILGLKVWASKQDRPTGLRRSYVCAPCQYVKDHTSGQVLMEDPQRFLNGDLAPLLRLSLEGIK